jgi:hypothetical protein
MAMLKKFINEAEVFALNDHLEWTVKEIGPAKSKVIVCDNFYKNPDMVRDLALQIPPSVNERIASNLPVGPDSGRINAFYLLDHIAEPIEEMFKQSIPEIYKEAPPGYFERAFLDATFLCNVMTSNNLPPRVPHCDAPHPYLYAALIYLNTPDECAGGTAFYTLGGNHRGNAYSMDAEGKVPVDHYVTDSEGDWEMLELIEMKYNRFVMYPQWQYHTAYIKPGMFVDGNYRINQVFFI